MNVLWQAARELLLALVPLTTLMHEHPKRRCESLNLFALQLPSTEVGASVGGISAAEVRSVASR